MAPQNRFLIGSIFVLLLAGLAVVFYPHPASSQAVASGRTFPCTPTRVWDADGPIWCAEGPRIRLAGIAAREMNDPAGRDTPVLTLILPRPETTSLACWAGLRESPLKATCS
jgi:hypothetical protein